MASDNQTATKKPLRVLHIAFTMHARGTETWLMNVMRRIDPKRVKMDFVTIEDEVGVYDEEIRKLGGTLHACPHPTKRGAFLRAFRKVLEDHGPYDVVHGHPYTLSGLLMLQAARAKIPVRITHSHTDRRKVLRDKSPFRHIYFATMKRLIRRLSTYGIAASEKAAASLFGKHWKNDKRWNVMYCGIDLEPFKRPPPENLKEKLGIPRGARVMGHVGGFYFEKNHDFLLDLFAHMAKKDLKLMLLLVGDGPLKNKVEKQAAAMGIDDRIIFTGMRQDVPAILSIMDVFIFPSLFEGLGLALVEAQAAGVPCLVSDAVPREASVNDELTTFMPLGDDIDVWIMAVQRVLNEDRPDKKRALSVVEKSEFNINHNVTMLTELYETLCGHDQKGQA